MLQQIRGRRSGWAIAALFVLGTSLGCGDDGSEDNDKVTAGKGGTGGTGGKGGSGSNTGGKGGQGGKDGSSDAGPASDELQGTGEKCQSYTEVKDGKCQGWYCGVTEAELKAAVNPKAKCGGDVPLLCKGSVTTKVGECARKVKIANATKPNEELKPLVRDCVYEDAEIEAKVPEDCLNCTIDVAVCAAEHCLGQCLGGDLPGCDTCRRAANCDQQVFGCGGLPAPIK